MIVPETPPAPSVSQNTIVPTSSTPPATPPSTLPAASTGATFPPPSKLATTPDGTALVNRAATAPPSETELVDDAYQLAAHSTPPCASEGDLTLRRGSPRPIGTSADSSAGGGVLQRSTIELSAAKKATASALARQKAQLEKEHAATLERSVRDARRHERAVGSLQLALRSRLSATRAAKSQAPLAVSSPGARTTVIPVTTSRMPTRGEVRDQTNVAPTATAMAMAGLTSEASRLDDRLLQIYVWAEHREARLRAAAAAQLASAKADVAQRTQEARSWHDVAEELATEHRDSQVLRVLALTRSAHLLRAFHDWCRAS